MTRSEPDTGRWLTGPVAITGADGHVGRAVRRRLAVLLNPVRPLGRSDDWRSAMSDADAVVHLAGTLRPRAPDTYGTANVGTAQRCVDAVVGSAVQRLVFLSYVDADPAADNAYLRAKGRAERLIGATGVATVILRSTLVHGDRDDIGPSFSAYQTHAGGSVLLLGDGAQGVAPIHVDDLAELLVTAALDPAAPTGTHDVGGLTVQPLDEFVRHINPPDIAIRHMPSAAARLLAHVVPRLTPALVDVVVADSVTATDPCEAAARFGVTLHHTAAVTGGPHGTPP